MAVERSNIQLFKVKLYRADKVMADGKQIGISTGRICSYYYNAIISLAIIDPKYAVAKGENNEDLYYGKKKLSRGKLSIKANAKFSGALPIRRTALP